MVKTFQWFVVPFPLRWIAVQTYTWCRRNKKICSARHSRQIRPRNLHILVVNSNRNVTVLEHRIGDYRWTTNRSITWKSKLCWHRTDGLTDGRTDEHWHRTDGLTDGRTDRRTLAPHGRTNGRTDRQTLAPHGRTDGQSNAFLFSAVAVSIESKL